MFAKNSGSTGIRKKQLESPEPKLRFKTSGMKGNREVNLSEVYWNMLSPKEKQEEFGDIFMYHTDKESKFAQYNYGDIEWSKLPDFVKKRFEEKNLQKIEWYDTLKKQNKERMERISDENREKVWNAMGGKKDIASLDFEESRKLWQEHGKYPYKEFG